MTCNGCGKVITGIAYIPCTSARYCDSCTKGTPRLLDSSHGLFVSHFMKEVHENAKAHGWYESPVTFSDAISNIHAELSEAFEEYRKGCEFNETYTSLQGKPEGIPSELADAVIRIFDTCAHFGIDLEAAIIAKHEYNKTRPYRHGGKKV